jgi:hypothetical protein
MAAIKLKTAEIQLLSAIPLQAKPVVVSINDALSDPGRFLQFVRAICAAPIMVFDATGYEPGVMLFLGIRAVVRRGITLTVTTNYPQRGDLKKLPFNIQEIKLIDLSTQQYGINDPKNPLKWLGDAVIKGLSQLQRDFSYMDLPPYNAVRCPAPLDVTGEPQNNDNSLMLCSFDESYINTNWFHVSNSIAIVTAPRGLERMLDIASPRLVGLALYESIRWTSCCIIDWTQWSPNVFFEFGVRLACSDIGPVCFIEDNKNKPVDPAAPKHQMQLMTLFDPTKYTLQNGIEPFTAAFERYDKTLTDQYIPASLDTLGHNTIYQEILNVYYWQQEAVSGSPHLDLIKSIQTQFGKDAQRLGNSRILYAANTSYARELRTSVQERYIAAWYYLKNRYTLEEIKASEDKRATLEELGKNCLQWLKNIPEYARIAGEISDLTDILIQARPQK